MNRYLEASEYIDFHSPNIQQKAAELAEQAATLVGNASADALQHAITQCCFEFVRDHIQHSWDYKMNPVTYVASDVLTHKTGYCYAKSHLLAALLRANQVPCGLCYQRLTITDVPPFCLHGLNAVFLNDHGWYRIDARGNKEGVAAAFCPPREKLAFPIRLAGEADLPEIWAEPLPVVIEALKDKASYLDVINHLPDIELASIPYQVPKQ